MAAHESRLALGTVQFGLAYGVSNKSGQVTEDQVQAILQFASDNGVSALDTAVGYGNAEETLGRVGVQGFQVTTKLPSAPADIQEGWVSRHLEGSLTRLQLQKLHCVLLHDPSALLRVEGREQFRQLVAAKADGLVAKIGLSIYETEALYQLDNLEQVDIVQSPVSILDRRALSSIRLAEMRNQGVELHARSVFLQGLLLMPLSEQVARFPQHAEFFESYKDWLEGLNCSPQEACLGFVLGQSEVSKVLVGVESQEQLADLLAIEKSRLQVTPPVLSADDLLLDPRRW